MVKTLYRQAMVSPSGSDAGCLLISVALYGKSGCAVLERIRPIDKKHTRIKFLERLGNTGRIKAGQKASKRISTTIARDP